MKTHVKFENTYQLTATKRFPESSVTGILRDVLESYLTDQKYEPEMCRKLSKTLSEVVISQMLPSYFTVMMITP